jgi:hypothetical protein
VSDRTQTAYHEAGHAVMSVLLKRRLDRVSINARGDQLGHVSRYGFRRYPPLTEGLRKQWALVAAAGPAAETIHRLKAGGAAGRNEIEGWLSDLEDVELLGCDWGPTFDGSVEFLRSQWSLVEAVATALLDAPGGCLTGKQVRHLTPRMGTNGH